MNIQWLVFIYIMWFCAQTGLILCEQFSVLFLDMVLSFFQASFSHSFPLHVFALSFPPKTIGKHKFHVGRQTEQFTG